MFFQPLFFQCFRLRIAKPFVFQCFAPENHWKTLCFSGLLFTRDLAVPLKNHCFFNDFRIRTLKNHWFFNVFGIRNKGSGMTREKPFVFQWFCASGLLFTRDRGIDPLKKTNGFSMILRIRAVIYKGSWHRPVKNQWFFNDFAHPGCYLQGIVASTRRPGLLFKNRPVNGFSMILRIRAVIYKGSWHRPLKNQWFFNDFAHPGCYLQGIVASTRKKPMVFQWFCASGLLFTRDRGIDP